LNLLTILSSPIVLNLTASLERGHPCPPEREARIDLQRVTIMLEELSVLRTLAGKDARAPIVASAFCPDAFSSCP
jgi:hypothetical protein